MDTSSPCQDLGSPHGVKQSYVNHKQCICNKNCIIEDSEVSELGTAVSRILKFQGVSLPVSGCIQSSDSSEICHPGMEKLCEEFEIEAKLSTGSTQKVLNKFVTFPISKNQPSCPVSMGGIKLTSTELHGPHVSVNPVCSSSLSLPTPSRLVSAMKGGREKEGIPTPLEKLKVKWAPDVRDPPATSLSHTVKSHNQQQRSNSKSNSNNKKHGKRKHKGKSSRGNNSSSDKKQYSKYICNSELCPVSSQVTGDRLLLGGLNQSSAELVTGQDSKCGSSFLMTSLTSMHISVAEAT